MPLGPFGGASLSLSAAAQTCLIPFARETDCPFPANGMAEATVRIT